MSDALLNAGRQTLMLELQEASRLPERLGDDFVRAANIIIHCEGKVIVSGIGKSVKRRTKNAKAFHDKCENFSFRASNETAVLITAFYSLHGDHLGYG